MSRSRRHTPIAGITTSPSEKREKKFAAQRARKHVADHLRVNFATDPEFDFSPKTEHPRSGGWSFAKDGKTYFGNSRSLDLEKAMRK